MIGKKQKAPDSMAGSSLLKIAIDQLSDST